MNAVELLHNNLVAVRLLINLIAQVLIEFML